MTLKEAYAIGNIIHNEVISLYEQQFDEIFKKCNIYPKFKSFRGNIHIRSKLIDKIYVDHETQLKESNDEIYRLNIENKQLIEHITSGALLKPLVFCHSYKGEIK